MHSTRSIIGTSILASMLLLGCSRGVHENQSSNETAAKPMTPAPSPAPSMSTPAPAAPATLDPTTLSVVGLSGPKPESWKPVAVESAMQTMRLEVPGQNGAQPAYVVVFFFRGGGGGIQPNIDRWAGQFMTPDGGPVEPITQQFDANGMAVTFVELKGTYQGMGIPAPEPDQLFLAGIVEAPIGLVFFRFVGPEATVEANREAFMALLHGLKSS